MIASTPLVVRADADRRIGAGHLMRSLALARRWVAAGGTATVVGRIASERLRQRVSASGVTFAPIDGASSSAPDLHQTLDYLEGLAEARGQRPVTVLDGYEFGGEYQESIRRRGFSLLVIDDVAHHARYHADLVLNQNLGAERLHYHGDADTRWLLGSRFVVLQPEFERWQNRVVPIAPLARRLLVTVGGADPHGATGLVMAALERIVDTELDVTLVVGPAAASPAAAVVGGRHRCHVVADVQDMASLMGEMDVAVTGAGTTCWELAYMGLPAIVMELADNQRGSARCLAAAGAVENAGAVDALAPTELAARLTALCADPARREAMSRHGQALVDGSGAGRVMARLAPPPLVLREATEADARALWTLANERHVREYAFSPEPIAWESHVVWLRARLAAADTRLWVLAANADVAAQVRYDLVDGAALVSISIAAAFRGFGLAARLLASTWTEACRGLGAGRARALVFTVNRASTAAFREAGFVQTANVLRVQGRECYEFVRVLE